MSGALSIAHNPQAIEQNRAERHAHFDAVSYDLEQVQHITPADPLIEGLLPLDSVAQVFGPSGSKKSFLCLDWALHVAHGLQWQDRDVAVGPVVYVVGEGVSGMGARVRAWLDHNGNPSPYMPIYFVSSAVNLFDSHDIAPFIEWCRSKCAVLVVFDTLARCTLGAEENSAKDMGAVVDALDLMRKHTGACVLTVHHSGKDGTRGGRGSTALKGALDTEIEVSSTGTTVTAKWTKCKDAAEPEPIRLEAIAVGDSLALTASYGTAGLVSSGALTSLATLKEIEIEGGIASGAWMEATGLPKTTFMGHRRVLLDAGQVVNVGAVKQPRYLSKSYHQELLGGE